MHSGAPRAENLALLCAPEEQLNVLICGNCCETQYAALESRHIGPQHAELQIFLCIRGQCPVSSTTCTCSDAPCMRALTPRALHGEASKAGSCVLSEGGI